MDPICVISDDGTKTWGLDGKIHRRDGPAIESPSGLKMWFINDECHRENAPAVIYSSGRVVWFKHGEIHRENGAAVEWDNDHSEDHKQYYLNGNRYIDKISWAGAVLMMHNKPYDSDSINDFLREICKREVVDLI